MRRRRNVSRVKRTVRNWLATAALVLALYVLGGCPALTKQTMAEEILRENLLSEGEIVWEETDWQGHQKLYLLSGGTTVRCSYHWNLLSYRRWNSGILYGWDGVTCIPSAGVPGQMLVMGNLPEAASATLELRVSNFGQDREYTAEGVWESGKVIRFTLAETYEDDEAFFEWFRRLYVPERYCDYTLRLYDGAGELVGEWNGGLS